MLRSLRQITISTKHSVLHNFFKIFVAIFVTLGLSISVQSVLASVFQTQATGLSIGNASLILSNGENLLWGPISNSSSGTGSFLLFQKGGVDKFRIDHDGNVVAAGGVRLGNYASKPTCDAVSTGNIVFDTTEDKPYVCASTGWKPLDSDYDKDGLTDWKDLDDNDSNPQNSVTNLLPENIKSGIDIFGVTGTLIGGMSSPATPVNFQVITGQTNSGVIDVSWEAPASYPIDGYKIYKNGALVDTVNEDTFSYSYTGLSNGVTYSLSVLAYNLFGDSSLVALNGKINNCYVDHDSDGYGTTVLDGYGVNGCYSYTSLYNTDCFDDAGVLCSTEGPSTYYPGAPYRSSLLGGSFCQSSLPWDFDCSGTISKEDHTGDAFLDSQSASTFPYYAKIFGTCGLYDWMTVSDNPWSESNVTCGQTIYWRNGEIPWNCDMYGFSTLNDCNTCSNPYNSANISAVAGASKQGCR